MKIKHLILGMGLGVAILGACNDDLGVVGPSIQPPGDYVNVANDTFHIEASTILMDAVYAKTDTALLGEIYDPLYGNLKSDYLCQFYCPENFRFSQTPIDGKIDSIDFKIFYKSSIGDTLVPMRAQIYQLTEPLKKDYYTNINPEEFCNKEISFGTQTYTAYDQTISDSIRKLRSYDWVTIRMPKEFGQKFYDETINNPSSFNNQQSFNQFFPGLYVTTTYGTGNVLNVSSSQMTIFYKYIVAGTDSIAKKSESFSVTKEVIQLSRFKNTDMSPLLQPSDQQTYIKAPAGVCTRLVFPMKEIIPKVKDRILNNLPLVLNAYPQENWRYAFEAMPNLLLIPEDSVKTFFENGQVNDNYSSFVSQTYNKQTYVFGNISNLIKYQIETNPDKDLAVWIIPVKYKATINQYTGVTTPLVVGNYMTPSAVKLRKDEDSRMIVVTSSLYGNENGE